MALEGVCLCPECFDDLVDLGVLGVLSELLPSVLTEEAVLLFDRRLN